MDIIKETEEKERRERLKYQETTEGGRLAGAEGVSMIAGISRKEWQE